MTRHTELLLPIHYFHLLFTMPHALNPAIAQNQAALYALLFEAGYPTLLEFGNHELGAQLGLTAVLHTWSQTLLDQYHLHCIVSPHHVLFIQETAHVFGRYPCASDAKRWIKVYVETMRAQK